MNATDPTSEQPAMIAQADSDTDVATIRELFTEYERAINVDLCFQGFAEELANLPGEYAQSAGGALLLARLVHEPAGCVAFRKEDADTCEVRRLYVRPEHRDKRIGAQLVGRLIAAARDAGYAKMQLHTLPRMERAVALYESFGFIDITGDRSVPIECVRYMELKL